MSKRCKGKIEIVECACGCGQEINKYDQCGRERKYISGHNSKTIDGRKTQTRRVVVKKYSNTDIIVREGMAFELQNDTPPNEYNPETKMTNDCELAALLKESEGEEG